VPNTFISYRRDDAAGYAGRLHEALEERLGSNLIFRDVDTLEPGQDFVDAIESRLAECRVFLAMIGREWLDAHDASGQRRLDQPRDYVRLEISRALARRDVRVIPVLIEGASMPRADRLPDEIRGLARKQALHLRDDAWEHDVERLIRIIRETTTTPAAHITPDAPSRVNARLALRGMGIAGAVVIAATLAWFVIARGRPETAGPFAGDPGNATVDGARHNTGGGQPYGIVIPRVSEVAHRSLLFTLISGSVVPLGNGTSELRLRFRFSNEGRYDANAWDASFRLALSGEALAPTGGLNEIVPGNSLRQWIVAFTIAGKPGPALLRVIEGDRVAEIPLDLSVTTRPAEDERADAGDALSRAIVRSIVSEPGVLIRDGSLAVSIERGSSRRFANVLRLSFWMRYTNSGRYPAGSGDAVLRLQAGDQVLAPIESPNLVIDANSNASGDVKFEVPSTTTRAVLHATIRGTSAEWPLELSN
jgi:hypothetical protein